MAHGFLSPQDVAGESPLFGKIAKWLEDKWNNREKSEKKFREEVSGKLDKLQKTVEVNVRDVTRKQAPAYKMLRASEPKALTGSDPKVLESGQPSLPPGGPRLPGSVDKVKKGGTITSLSGDGDGISPDTFFNRAQSGVGASGEYLTNAQRREAFIKSRQETVKTAAATNAPAISPDSGADIVAAVSKNTEAIVSLVKITKDQTANDTKLSEKAALTQEKLMGRQRAAAEERSLEEGKDMSGFLSPVMKKIEKKTGAGPGGQGYSGQLGDGGPNVMDMLDIGSDIMDMRKGKVRRITQGRDGRTARQRLRDTKARKAGLNPSRAAGRGGGLARTGGSALSRGAGMGKGLGTAAKGLGGAASKGGALGGLGGGLKGAAKGLGKSGPLALLTAGLEFGDRMSSGQNALQAGVGTAGSVGGGLAGAAAGAAIGSVIPGVGTVIGGLLGGMLGSMAGGGVADMATGANNIPSGAGGMLSSGPMSGYMSMLHGTELTLSGNNKKETKNIGEAVGEGMIMASLGPLNPKVLELSAKGMKHFYENMGGKDIMASIFEGVTDALGAVGNMLGSVANSLLGGAAHAGTMYGGGMSADEQQLTEALIAGEEGVKTEAYKDSEGIWTIGYGQTTLNGRAVREGDKISKEEALTGFRSNLKSHAQRAINQVGEKRWQEMDPKMRAVLTSLAYNYGSIPDRVLQEAKTGTPEDLAKAMDKLYGDNNGDLKGRRQREQSILRGNMQGTAGNAVRLDKDFLAGGKFAGAGTGPSVIGAGPSGAAAGQGGKIVEYLTGNTTSSGYRADHGGGNYHDHIAFDSKETRDAAAAFLKTKGWKIGSMNDGRHADGSYHYSDQAFDIPFYPNQSIKGVPDNASGETQLSSALRRDLAMGGFTGAGVAAVPGGPVGPNSLANQNFNIPGAPQLSAVLNQNNSSSPSLASAMDRNANWNAYTGQTSSPLSAASATPSTGPQMMQTSAQVSMPQVASAQPIIVNNNYYTNAGGGNQQQLVPNALNAGISMDATGTASFQDLRIRTLS